MEINFHTYQRLKISILSIVSSKIKYLAKEQIVMIKESLRLVPPLISQIFTRYEFQYHKLQLISWCNEESLNENSYKY